MRLIDADLLKADYFVPSTSSGTTNYMYVSLFQIVNAPTVDAIPVVRCKDCKHLSEDRIAPEWHRICRKYGVGKPDDGFCDEVERKETEDE